jgi:hypothetical protein
MQNKENCIMRFCVKPITHGTKRAQKDKLKNVLDKACLMREVMRGKGGKGERGGGGWRI